MVEKPARQSKLTTVLQKASMNETTIFSQNDILNKAKSSQLNVQSLYRILRHGSKPCDTFEQSGSESRIAQSRQPMVSGRGSFRPL